jgi:hypothetical protein
MINLLIRLLQAGAGFFAQVANFVWSVAFVATVLGVDVETLERWWQGAPQEQAQSQPLPVLGKEAEALYFQVVQLMENQQQVDELKRDVLTLPALPEEGY